jgi:cysteine desulfurase/selenocysteine lyase
VVLTRGTTESINLVAHGWGRRHIGAGDVILLTEMEHHSNVVPWQLLAQHTGARLDYAPIRDDGALDMDAFEQKLAPEVKLVAATHMSNVLGTINPIRRMAASAHRVGARILVDGAQSVPHFPVDVRDLDCDFLAFSGHKAVGPTGIGVLVAKEECLEAMDPFMGGGEMINKVGRDTSTWAEIPHKFEAGTPNIAGAIGLTAAIRYLSGIGLDAVQQREEVLAAYARRRLGEVDGLRLLGSAPERGGVLSFVLDGAHPHDIAQFVDQEGIAIRAGHMCAQPLMRALGLHAVSRASLYLYTLEEEIDRLAEALVRARDFFAHGI